MKTYALTAILGLALLTSSHASEIPGLARTATFIITTPQYTNAPVAEGWTRQFKAPLKIRMEKPIKTLAEHLAVIASIPNEFLSGLRIGDTIEVDDWIITSLDPANLSSTNSLWIKGVATVKGGKEAIAWSNW